MTRNDEGWIAEFQIPFKTLRFSKSTSQEWGVNVNRRILRLNENSNWSPIPVRYGISRVSLAGVLQGLENIHQGRNLKIKPFVTAAFTEARQNQASISFVIDQTFDRLTRDDRVLGVSIPRGDYKYRSYSANASTDRRRRIGGNGRFTWGDFWDGARTSFDSAVNLRPTYRWNIDLIYSRNRVALMSGRGATDLFGTRLVYGFSPHAFFNAFVQYNAATQRLSSNLRFNWIHHPLSDLYVVYNDTRDTATGQRVDRALIIKFTNLFNF